MAGRGRRARIIDGMQQNDVVVEPQSIEEIPTKVEAVLTVAEVIKEELTPEGGITITDLSENTDEVEDEASDVDEAEDNDE